MEIHVEYENNHMKKIMVITNIDSGLYNFRKELLIRLIKENNQVVIVAPMETYKQRFIEIGCKCVHTKLERRGMNPLKDIKLLLFYRKLILQEKPDIVLTYTIKPNIYAGIACQITRTPYLANVTGLGTSIMAQSVITNVILSLYKLGLRKAHCVFFQNEYNLNFMKEQGCVKRKQRLLAGSGINLEEFQYHEYPREDAIRFLTIGRIMKDKGIGELLEIAPRIYKEFPNVVFELLGDYEVEDQGMFEPMIEYLQRQGIVHYYGYQENVCEYMKQSHVLVHPSYHEGMSNVILEAAATGRVVVANNIPGCREIVIDGKTGVLCNPQDVESLYQGIVRILKKTTEEREKMGRAAREHVAIRFNRNQVVEAYLQEIQIIEEAGKKK